MKMAKMLKWFLALALLLPALSALAQPGAKVWGTVYEESGLPAVGAVVLEAGTADNAAVTDANGQFALTLSRDGASLTVSLFGFKEVSVLPEAGKATTVFLQEESRTLEEAVVIGYGVQKKEFLTGSVASKTGKEILKAPVANVSQTMYGQFAGLALHTDYGTAGEDVASFLIRGKNQPDTRDGSGFIVSQNQPIAVIDGVKCGIDQISRLNPNDIESISVLKDAASTAVYGTQGSNGVVVVTTKKGGTSGQNSVQYDGAVTFTRNTMMPDLMNAEEYIKYTNLANSMDGRDVVFDEAAIEKMKQMGIYADTDNLSLIFKPFGFTHQHNVSASGGNERVSYYSSLGVMSQDGIIRKNDYQRYNFRNNVSVNLAKGLRYEMNVAAQYSRKNLPVIDLRMQSEYSPVRAAFYNAPLLASQYTDADGNVYPLGMKVNNIYTYTPWAQLDDGYKHSQNFRLDAASKLEFHFGELIPVLQGLRVSLFGAATYSTTSYQQYQYPFKQASFDPYTTSVTIINFKPYPEDYFFKSQNYSWNLTLRPQISYERTFGKHSVSALGLFEGEFYYVDVIDGWGSDFATDNPIDLEYARKASTNTNNGYHDHSGNASFVYRLNYNYAGKYIVETSGRVNESYLFPAETRRGFFPSVSLAWVASNEAFLKDRFSWLNHLKLRASVGQTGGTDGIGAYAFMERYHITGTHAYGIGRQPVLGFYTSGYGNRSMTWSHMTDYNFGVDAVLLNNKLTVGLDVFYQYRDKILESLVSSYAPSIGGNNPSVANTMKVDNRGVELMVRHDNWFSNGITYSLQGMVSWARNRLLASQNVVDDHPAYRQVLGRPMDELYGYEFLDLVRDEAQIAALPDPPGGSYALGEPIYRDVNGDGRISSDYDFVRIGHSSTPELNFSLNALVSWRNLSLSALFQGAAISSIPLVGAFNNGVVNSTIYSCTFYGMNYSNGNADLARNSWTPENPGAKYPRLHSATNMISQQMSDLYVISGSYLRLKNLQLSYALPAKVVRVLGMTRASVYVAGTNLFTLSGYKWMDPENPGLNEGFVPQQKTYSIGLNLTF
ncbi:MAG: TonB-dependent receptor [Bacteroidales bacterium]|nr:TonB-dependent receptor [Bacteroidales bacterium]